MCIVINYVKWILANLYLFSNLESSVRIFSDGWLGFLRKSLSGRDLHAGDPFSSLLINNGYMGNKIRREEFELSAVQV